METTPFLHQILWKKLKATSNLLRNERINKSPSRQINNWLETTCQIFIHLLFQGGDSDDDVEGFAGSDDTQPSSDSMLLPSQDLEGVSTYGEEDLVPEPHRVSNATSLVVL